MASRSIPELVHAATKQRDDAVVAGRDPQTEQFRVTEEEREMLRYTPLTAASREYISAERDRVCGMMIVVGSGKTMTRRRR